MEMHVYSSGQPKDYFNQGKQFLEAAWRCFGKKSETRFIIFEDGELQQLPAPCVVNAAFSCEMFLKALLNKLNITYDRNKEGHMLYSLYKKLPCRLQVVIAKFCGNENDATIFENLIKKHSNDFVDVRYFIEHNEWKEISPMVMLKIADNLSRIVDYFLTSSDLEDIM